MANTSPTSSTASARDFKCNVCNLFLDTVESLDVHLQYHKENLYAKWGMSNQDNVTEYSNGANMNFDNTVSTPAVSNGSMMSNEFQPPATPEASAQYTHPATPHSYHSTPSPYQNVDQNAFSPDTQFNNNYSSSPQNQQSEQNNWDQSQYVQNYFKASRYQPYNIQDRGSQASSSGSGYEQTLSQPTPSPSPSQCNKCGVICESPSQLNEHCNTVHAENNSVSASNYLQYQQYNEAQFSNSCANDNIKTKEDGSDSLSSDILDLDSQKVLLEEDGQSSGNIKTELSWEAQKLYNSIQNENNKFFNSQNQDQKYEYIQKSPGFHAPNSSMQIEQRYTNSGVQMPQNMIDNMNSGVSTTKTDIKPPYRPYEHHVPAQVTSTQFTNPISNVPATQGKGANWKSNEPRRPKTYNCVACNKWFTSSGHLKRHYNTTLHKNAVRSSGKPDPATMPISNHHHPSRESAQAPAQQQLPEAASSAAPQANRRGSDNAVPQLSYSPNHFNQPPAATVEAQSGYQQGNLDHNHFINHSVHYQVGLEPNTIDSQQPVIKPDPNDSQTGSKGVNTSSAGNHPNGEAGPSAFQNHHMRGLLSVSTNNILSPTVPQTTPALTPLPPFNHLGVTPFTPVSMGSIMASVPSLNHTPLYIGQNFQENFVPSYPNGMTPHVMDTAINNMPIASPATFGETTSKDVEIMELETLNELPGGRLPSFSQLQTPSFSVYVSNYMSQPNVGDENTSGYVILDSVNSLTQQNIFEVSKQTGEYDYSITPRATKDNVDDYSTDPVKVNPYGIAVGGTTMKQDFNVLQTHSNHLQILKIENIMDYANKENYGVQLKSPSSPEASKVDNKICSSPNITSTVNTPLADRDSNQVKKPQVATIHKCYECDKVFNKACYLTQHNKTFHSGEKPFKCDRCGKRFADDVTYEGHCQKHTDNKPFKCPVCPKSFNHKTDLRRHMCLHSGSKPFACDHCGKGFIRKDHMVKHYEIHLKKNGARPRVM